MKFLSLRYQNVTVYSVHYCGDQCCSWEERDSEYVNEGAFVEPEFEYGSYPRTDEKCFYERVKDCDFAPLDEEAVAWVAEKQKEEQV